MFAAIIFPDSFYKPHKSSKQDEDSCLPLKHSTWMFITLLCSYIFAPTLESIEPCLEL
uniref:Uncharacterized protein n=1 Tax=Rhizophora mucronata TaxID=61149 RepID=A0A2P2Q5V3_RHIMU